MRVIKICGCWFQRGGSRRIWHGQYTRWPDYGVPGGGSAAPVLRFLARTRRAQALALHDLDHAWAGHKQGPPIVVHCSAGIGRTGTYCYYYYEKVCRTMLLIIVSPGAARNRSNGLVKQLRKT